MSTFFTADTHFGHKNIISHTNRPFGSVREMDDELLRRWNSVVSAKDEVYHVGDFGIASPGHLAGILGKLKGRIHLVTGNHDKKGTALHAKCSSRFESIQPVLELYVSDRNAPKGNQMVFLFHYSCRSWPKKHWGSWHLYGHSHGKLPDEADSLSFDCGVDCWDFTPVSYAQVRARMAQKTWRQPFKTRGENADSDD